MTVLRIAPSTSREDLARALAASDRGHAEDAPLQVILEPGTYDLAVNPLAIPREHKQIFGEGARLVNGTTPIASDARTLLVDGLEMDGADFGGLGGEATTQLHILQNLYCHDLAKARDGIGCDSLEGSTLSQTMRRKGWLTPATFWTTRILHSRFHEWTGAAGTTHNIYMHGDEGLLEVGHCEFAGGSSSAIKSTRNHNHIHHNRIFTERPMLDGLPPVGGRAFSKGVDLCSFSTSTVEYNEFHLCRGRAPGTTEAIFFMPRRSRYCNDRGVTPADVTYQRDAFAPFVIHFASTGVMFDAVGVCATLNGAPLRTPPISKYLSVEQRPINKSVWYVTIHPDEMPASGVYALGIEHDGERRPYEKPLLTVFRDDRHLLVSSWGNATVETLSRSALPDWWRTLGDLADGANEWALRKTVRGNVFRRYHPDDFGTLKPIRTIRDDGTYPRSELRQFSLENYWHPVAEGWRERSVVVIEDNDFGPFFEDSIRMGAEPFRPGVDVRFGVGTPHWIDAPESTAVVSG